MTTLRVLLICVIIYVTCTSLLFAQNKNSEKDDFTRTIENLQKIKDKNEKLKLEKSPTIDVLLQLRSYDLAKIEDYLSSKGWVFSGSNKTDSLTTEINFAFNSTLDNKAWYTIGYVEDEQNGNMLVFSHSSDAIQKKAANRLKELLYDNINTSVTDEGLSKCYAKKQNSNSFVFLNTKNTKTGYGNLINYRIFIMDKKTIRNKLNK